jgi:hypothetical protein
MAWQADVRQAISLQLFAAQLVEPKVADAMRTQLFFALSMLC